MPIAIITSIISAISIITGTLVGAYCSWIINRKMHKTDIKEQYALLEENRKYEETYKVKELCTNANLIRLDLCTSIFQSIRSLQNKDESKQYLFLLPINKNYSCTVASLSDKYTLKELSYLYQLYGIIQKVNREINNWNSGDKGAYENIRKGFVAILTKIYGENYVKLLLIDINKISYQDLHNNDFIKDGYKEVLVKLDYLCAVENILKDKANGNVC